MKYEASDGSVKIEALKDAVAELGQAFDNIDPDKKFIRTGADAFSSEWVEPVDLAWGSTHVVEYANGLKPWGFTIPTDALEKATKSLTATAENKSHTTVNGGKPKK